MYAIFLAPFPKTHHGGTEDTEDRRKVNVFSSRKREKSENAKEKERSHESS
jgi:hypothetical protein